MHNGGAAIGSAVATYRDGKYSKYMPQRMAAGYQIARNDPEIVSSREEIALIDCRLAEMLGRVDSGESGATWRSLQKAVAEFNDFERRAIGCTDSSKRAELLSKRNDSMAQIQALTATGAADYEAWSEVKSLIERRRRTVETEQKRLVAMDQMITNERALGMIDRISQIIQAHVRDPIVLKSVAVEIKALITRDNANAPGGCA